MCDTPVFDTNKILITYIYYARARREVGTKRCFCLSVRRVHSE